MPVLRDSAGRRTRAPGGSGGRRLVTCRGICPREPRRATVVFGHLGHCGASGGCHGCLLARRVGDRWRGFKRAGQRLLQEFLANLSGQRLAARRVAQQEMDRQLFRRIRCGAIDDFFHGCFSMTEPERFIGVQASFEPKGGPSPEDGHEKAAAGGAAWARLAGGKLSNYTGYEAQVTEKARFLARLIFGFDRKPRNLTNRDRTHNHGITTVRCR